MLVLPPLAEAGRLADENRRRRGEWHYDVQGRPLAELISQARSELLHLAGKWTAAYRPEAAAHAPQAAEGPIFLAGHQPELFHPGVWMKNFALGGVAARHGGVGVNLLIDSDLVKNTSLGVPGGSVAEPSVEMIPLDRAEPRVPYEERRVVDRRTFAEFGRRTAARLAPLVADPLVASYWPLAISRLEQTDNLGACLAQSRHLLEGRWGLSTLEAPQSWICETESFAWFAAHLLANLPRLREAYNEALREYRRVHRIRGAGRPAPDLQADGPWLEAPFWVWTVERPERRRLFARSDAADVVLADRKGLEIRLALSAEGDLRRAVEQLAQWRERGVKIRSRALLTTLWARLALGDLFLHGIGGAKYDQVTDLLFQRFFGLCAPSLMVISATLHLPIARPPAPADPGAAAARLQREFTHHPERFLQASDEENFQVRALVEAKRRWIDAPQTPANARPRWQALRRINEELQPWLAQQRREAAEREGKIRRARDAEKILAWREYGFCLYPEKTIREFLARLLPKMAETWFDTVRGMNRCGERPEVRPPWRGDGCRKWDRPLLDPSKEERVEGARKGFARMSSSVASSGLSEAGDKQWAARRVRCPVLPARACDHEPIFRFLAPICPKFSVAGFKASLADPFYEPRDRLLLKRAAASLPTSTLPTASCSSGRCKFPSPA